MKSAFTVDLEEYFHVTAFAEAIDPSQWEQLRSRVEPQTERLLELLTETGQRATFFVLGWVAERHAPLVSRVAARGHEIACHSYWHRFVYSYSPGEFREDTRRAKCVLEDIVGAPVLGYRAPSFSISSTNWWAFEVLAELGFTYDSSIFPIHHPNYGMPEASRTPFLVKTPSGSILEFPMPTLEFLGTRVPFGGGAYLRFLPYGVTRRALRFLHERERRPACLYVHPWEIDPQQPRVSARLSARLRHYVGLGGTIRKLERLLRDFEFVPLRDLIASQVPHANAVEVASG